LSAYSFGAPELVAFVAPLRYVLVALALAWAVALARGRRALALSGGLVFVLLSAGFWSASLGRPYGLLEDAAATRRAAEVRVAAATGRAGESFVAGEPARNRAWAGLLETGISAEALQLLPSVLPAASIAAVGLAVLALWGRRSEALGGACLWLAFATGQLESARGLGVLPGAWARPEAALALPLLAALALGAGRLPGRFGAAAAALAALASLLVPAPGAPPSLPDALLLLTLDQLPWLGLSWLAGWRAIDRASLGLLAGGGLSVLLCAASGRADAWTGHALYRLGLLLACCSPELWRTLADVARPLSPRLAALPPRRLAPALLIALLVPGGFATWWEPLRVDPVARASREPVSAALAPLMAFVQDQTPRDAVFVASPDYAPALAALGGRRVLRAPSLLRAADDEQRLRAEGAILAGRPLPGGAHDHGARFVLLAPGDFRARGIGRPEDLEGRPGFRTRYTDALGYRVYEVVR
jgi:hypothetical protein